MPRLSAANALELLSFAASALHNNQFENIPTRREEQMLTFLSLRHRSLSHSFLCFSMERVLAQYIHCTQLRGTIVQIDSLFTQLYAGNAWHNRLREEVH